MHPPPFFPLLLLLLYLAPTAAMAARARSAMLWTSLFVTTNPTRSPKTMMSSVYVFAHKLFNMGDFSFSSAFSSATIFSVVWVDSGGEDGQTTGGWVTRWRQSSRHNTRSMHACDSHSLFSFLTRKFIKIILSLPSRRVRVFNHNTGKFGCSCFTKTGPAAHRLASVVAATTTVPFLLPGTRRQPQQVGTAAVARRAQWSDSAVESTRKGGRGRRGHVGRGGGQRLQPCRGGGRTEQQRAHDKQDLHVLSVASFLVQVGDVGVLDVVCL